MDDVKGHIIDVMHRHNMNLKQASIYFGVPIHTLRKWISGERIPSASVGRLVYVLGMIETLAPMIHDSLIEQ